MEPISTRQLIDWNITDSVIVSSHSLSYRGCLGSLYVEVLYKYILKYLKTTK